MENEEVLSLEEVAEHLQDTPPFAETGESLIPPEISLQVWPCAHPSLPSQCHLRFCTASIELNFLRDLR